MPASVCLSVPHLGGTVLLCSSTAATKSFGEKAATPAALVDTMELLFWNHEHHWTASVTEST